MNRPAPDRRSFLQAAAAAPLAFALPGRMHWLPRGDPRMLLVLELEGGNDGLNTLIPTGDDAYARLRPHLSAVRHGARELEPGQALHGSLRALHARLRAGGGAVVQGVGYESPDRSHFRSRDIWHTADPAHVRARADTTGWLGRAAEQMAAAGAGMPAASVGSLEVPLLLRGGSVVVPCVRDAGDFTLQVPGPAETAARGRAALAELVAREPLPAGGGAFAHAAAMAAAAAQQASALREGLQRYRPRADYPDTELGRGLQLVAQLAVAGFGTRLFHLGFGGFDTHARQLPTHAGLLAQLDAALEALLADLHGHGRLAHTAVLVHSEFGRRAAENQSLGTDHGAAAPVFVLGGGVRPGLLGRPPALGALVDGDVPATTDFRSVYAALLRWLEVPTAAVLPAGPEPLPLFDA